MYVYLWCITDTLLLDTIEWIKLSPKQKDDAKDAIHSETNG